MATVTQIIQRRRRREERRHAIQTRNRWWFVIGLALFSLLVIAPVSIVAGGGGVMYWRATRDLPQPLDTIAINASTGATQLFDRSGETLLFAVQDPLGDQRAWIDLDSLPPYLIDATLVMEDPFFLETAKPGLAQAMTRLWQNAIYGPLAADPSLTGRLVRNALAQPGEFPSAWDREREIALVAEVNRRYSPQEILEWHLNTNYYGNEAYGIEAAARVYLGKSASDLTLDEAALLAAIPSAPQYNPFDNEIAARGRQDDALRALQQSNKITLLDYDLAVSTLTPIQTTGGQTPEIAPDFAFFARRQAKEILDETLGRDSSRLFSRGGLRIITTLDLDLYYQSECALRTHLLRLSGNTSSQPALDGQPCQSAAYLPPTSLSASTLPPDTGTLAVIDVYTGEIKSMVGPANAAIYQPGPALYPFVYFTGFLSARVNPASMVQDIPKPFPGAVEGLIYTPANPDGQFRGPINLRDAMSAWLLAPAVDVANRFRLDSVLQYAHRIGLNSLNQNTRYDLSLLERGGEVSVLDVAYAYSVLASMGEMRGIDTEPVALNYRVRNPVAVLRIEDGAGNILWEYSGDQYEPDCAVAAATCTPVFEKPLGYLINDILADQPARLRVIGDSVNAALDVSRPAAVVNGKTADNRDSWTIGYTPQTVVSVRLGRQDSGEMTLDPFALQGAAPVWQAITEYAHTRDSLPALDWTRPENITQAVVCERSGLLPNGVCPVRNEIFIRGTGFEPYEVDTFWQEYDINTQTEQLATVNTPEGLRSRRVYFVPPEDALDWWTANNQPLPPREYDSVSRPELLGTAAILQPAPFAYVGGVVDVRGSMDDSNMQFYQLAYGQGLNPSTWTQIGEQQAQFTRGASLGAWDTNGLDGLYSLRLTVVLNDNKIDSDVRQVTVDNLAPTITLTAGETGKIYRWPEELTIELTADVVDNLAIDHVEFYHNGEFIGTDPEWPYGFSWDIAGAGSETFSAVAFDAVGNQANSEITVEVIRSS